MVLLRHLALYFVIGLGRILSKSKVTQFQMLSALWPSLPILTNKLHVGHGQ